MDFLGRIRSAARILLKGDMIQNKSNE